MGLHYLPMLLLMRSGDVETNPGPNTSERNVSEEEFLELSKLIDSSYYKRVGVELQLSWSQLSGIKHKSDDISEAYMKVFMRWRDKHHSGTNTRATLAEKLKNSGLGVLSDRVHDGSLISIVTDEPSRPLEARTRPPPDESQIEPLSPELIERCAKDFKFKYQSTLCKIRSDPLNPASLVQFDDLHINLVLRQEEHKSTAKHMGQLDYNDILDCRIDGEYARIGKRFIVQGEAGAGKTTLCAKIAWDWVEGRHFSHFVWVLVVPFCGSKQYTIGEIAKSYLAKNNPATASQITEFICANPDKVFIAFDGLDNFSGQVRKQGRKGSNSGCQQSQTSDQTQLQSTQPTSACLQTTSEALEIPSQKVGIGLVDVLYADQLASCPVLVTTRPWRAREFRFDRDLFDLYIFMQVEGFSKENVSLYIHKYFPDDEPKANRLIQLTNNNDVISEYVAHYPIYRAMLCLMWKELGEQKLNEISSLGTFSKILQEMVGFLKENYAQKIVERAGSPERISYLEEVEKHLEPVAKLALTGLLKNTFTFREGDFQEFPESMKTACTVGILLQGDIITSSLDENDKRNSDLHLPVFFPCRQFQEYIAGVHLASLYESDRKEFDRLMEKEVMPRKNELRYLLYFTVSQNKNIANHVLKCLVQVLPEQGATYISDWNLDFIADVAFESQDTDVAALVRDKLASTTLVVKSNMTAHTVAGYAFTCIPLKNLHVKRNCGPTMSLDIVEMICSIPSLEYAGLQTAPFHSDLFALLAKKGKESKVQWFSLEDVKCLTPASSDHLAEALCSMPHLTKLTLDDTDLHEEFCSSVKAKASFMQVKTLHLSLVKCLTPAAFHQLAEALCTMPNLTDLTLGGGKFDEEFFSSLKEMASFIQVHTLSLRGLECSTPASSHYLAEALCHMTKLTNLKLFIMHLTEEFCSSFRENASAIQLQTLDVQFVRCPTLRSTRHLAEALCYMPNLTRLALDHMGFKGDFRQFCSTLKGRASSIQGCFPQVSKGNFRFNDERQKDLDSFLYSLALYNGVWNWNCRCC